MFGISVLVDDLAADVASDEISNRSGMSLLWVISWSSYPVDSRPRRNAVVDSFGKAGKDGSLRRIPDPTVLEISSGVCRRHFRRIVLRAAFSDRRCLVVWVFMVNVEEERCCR